MTFNVQTLFNTAQSYRGGKFVWVKNAGDSSRSTVLNGNKILNPYKGVGYAYAADLFEYKLGGSGYLLKTFKVAAPAAIDATTIYVNGDGYSHVPEVGNILMKAGATADTKAQSATVTAVTWISSTERFAVVLDKALGVLTTSDILVEAATAADITPETKGVYTFTMDTNAAAGDMLSLNGQEYVFSAGGTGGTYAVGLSATATVANIKDAVAAQYAEHFTVVADAADLVFTQKVGGVGDMPVLLVTQAAEAGALVASIEETEAGVPQSGGALPLVTNPNSFVEVDTLFVLPTDGSYGIDSVAYYINTIYKKEAFIARMQPLPAYVLGKNRSYIDGIFEL